MVALGRVRECRAAVDVSLFSPVGTIDEVAPFLARLHYLGPCRRGKFAWSDELGVVVFASPSSRNLPTVWLELSRWCLLPGKNNGTRQWAGVVRWLQAAAPDVTTVVSYSDPARGHTEALYRACNWLWAPTWHRLRPPPTGQGSWSGKQEGVKDRWVYPLRPDPWRAAALSVKDAAVMTRMPWAEYREPKWNGLRYRADTGGGDYKRFVSARRKGEYDSSH